jgi:3-phosphoshikimate 1-carboxyvinyltransferase
VTASPAVLRVPTAPNAVDAVVRVPGSKSIANRALVCAALATGESRLRGLPPGDDTLAMLDGLRALGATVDAGGDEATVTGADGALAGGPGTVHARLAGTTSRFLTAVSALGAGPTRIDGDPPLRRRPMAPLHDALVALGAHVTSLEGARRLPVEVAGPLVGGTVSLPGDVSSQYVTALMLVGPYLPDGLRISLTSGLVSRPYVELTRRVMRAFGADDVRIDERDIEVGRGHYVGTELDIEPDASSASYPLAIAAVAGGTVRVEGLGPGSWQGDARFAELLEVMGCHVEVDELGTTVSRSPLEPLRGIAVDLADASDLVPTVAAVAVLASTPSWITGVGFIRAKESDRLGDLAGELRRLGARVEVTADGLAIEPSTEPLRGARLRTHHDHRLAMAFGVVGSVVPGVEVEEPDVVAKSWPGYWDAVAAALDPARG